MLDATGKTLGRLSTQAASILAGKNNVLYTPYIDMGDHVIVVNCEKIVLTGLKADKKLYRRYTAIPPKKPCVNEFVVQFAGAPASFLTLIKRCRLNWRTLLKSKMGRPDGDQAEGLQGTPSPASGAAAGVD